MKNILLLVMIVLTGCYSETDPTSNSAEPQVPKQAPEQTEPSLGLTFGGIPDLDDSQTEPGEVVWPEIDQIIIDDMVIEILPVHDLDFDPPVVETGQGNYPYILPGNIPFSIREKWYSKDPDDLEELLPPSNCE